jgi:outer membrane protein insertion porin family
MSKIQAIGLGALLFAISACNPARRLETGAVRYGGAEVSIEDPGSRAETRAVQANLNALLRPTPPTNFELWAHRLGQKEKQWFVDRYLARRYGRAPVLTKDINPKRIASLMENRLENMGYFHYQVAFTWEPEKRRSQALTFTIKPGTPYRVAALFIDSSSVPESFLLPLSLAMQRNPYGKSQLYNLDLLKETRNQIDETLKNRGYYNFSPDYLIFKADTNHYQDRQMDLYLSIKPEVPEDAFKPHKIAQLMVRPGNPFNIRDEVQILDSALYEDAWFTGTEVIHPKYLYPYIYTRPGLTFSQFRQNRTLNRMGQMGAFRFATIRYQKIPSEENDTIPLRAELILSPLTKRAIGYEFQALSRSNNFLGPAVLLTYRNRNLFKGAELLQLSLKGSFETQVVGGRQTGLNSIEVGGEGELIFPRITPFKVGILSRARYSVPQTRIKLSYNLLNRVQFYNLTSLLLSYGYRWQSAPEVSHEWNPISINLVNAFNITPAFQQILNENPFLARSFEQQFILGSTYSIQYNTLVRERETHNYFALFNSDLSGLMVSGVEYLSGAEEASLFGLPFAQYARFDVDLRYYKRVGPQHKWIFRAFAGRAIPVGNTLSLPFIKQYFSGGPNSVRGFRIRSLGPGTYRSETQDISSFFDQSGDIRLEFNLEYRHPITGFFKGAAFIDAGNIWLVNDNPALPGGQISSDWYRELAMGIGYGLRIDLDFFVVRFDLATPLRKPFLPEGARWISAFQIGNRTWRRENLILNFAIGYPF